MHIEFPRAVRINNRLYFAESEIEAYKRAIIRGAADSVETVAQTGSKSEKLIPAKRVAEELGVCVRTLKRRITGGEIRIGVAAKQAA